jgi:hypothetical protein
MVVDNAGSSRRKVLAAALHIHAAKAERGSYLERDLMAGADALTEADAEIAGLAVQNSALRVALERADATLNGSDEGARTRKGHKAKLVETTRGGY